MKPNSPARYLRDATIRLSELRAMWDNRPLDMDSQAEMDLDTELAMAEHRVRDARSALNS